VFHAQLNSIFFLALHTTSSVVCRSVGNMSGESKILIVEDHEPTAMLLAALLMRAGCTVEIASNGTKAMQLAQKGRFQLITLDVDLPDMSGFEIFGRLRQNPSSSRTPILFVSGRSDEKSWRRGIELGAIDYIEKPFGGPAFTRRILSHLKVTSNHDSTPQLSGKPKK
jgi:DNA-binding response OmpR family regulator